MSHNIDRGLLTGKGMMSEGTTGGSGTETGSRTGASSTGANSTGANSTGASSTGASSTGASSTGASSTGANSTGASSPGASSAGASSTGASTAGATSIEANLIEDRAGIQASLRESKRLAILGIKPDNMSAQPAYYVPAYLKQAGYDVVPVPVYYPEVTEILGQPVQRNLAEVADVDMVIVFRKSADVAQHVDDIIAAKPKYVWFQLGIRNDEAARKLAAAGIKVVQDRCTMVEHRSLRG